MPADTGRDVSVTLPTSYSSTNYSVTLAMSKDAGNTNYLRQNGHKRYVSSILFYFYNSTIATQSNGTFTWIAIGY